ncbi:hypothetical protein KWK45_018510, partial [Clostridioides difficile]|nr:hypothetical protein [Clostridioides difficile]
MKNLSNKFKFIFLVFIILVLSLVSSYLLKKDTPKNPVIMYENHNYIFMGQSELLDNYDVYSVGSVLKSVDEIPKENFASYKIAVGT